jgi:hypothetical protein
MSSAFCGQTANESLQGKRRGERRHLAASLFLHIQMYKRFRQHAGNGGQDARALY